MELTALETSFLVTDFHSPYHFPRVVISKDNELFKYCLTCFFFPHSLDPSHLGNYQIHG